MNVLLRWMPLLSLVLFGGYFAFYWNRARRLAAAHPDRARGYATIVRALILYCGTFSVVWTAAAMLGLLNVAWIRSAPSVMNAQALTVMDVVVYVLWAAIAVRFSIWLYARSGAEMLAAHNDLFNGFPHTAAEIKVFWAIALAVSIGSMAFRFMRP